MHLMFRDFLLSPAKNLSMDRSDSEEQSYRVSAADFTATGGSHACPGAVDAASDRRDGGKSYFSTRVGFEVGTFCDGPRRFYSQGGGR